ncbi:MAG: aminotransferase class I/II-fold pyridoxal phosphate-dependent enzyme [Acidimicrobiales bacterium]
MSIDEDVDTRSPGTSPAALPWMGDAANARRRQIVQSLDLGDLGATDERVHALIERNRQIHDRDCINLNPATNTMNPRAEAVLAAGLTTRPSLGHAGEKYEMGLEAIEEIEVIAAEAARRVFGAEHVEIRVGSGGLANLYAFMATCQPGDSIIVPPASIGGHVTHRAPGAAGLYGLQIHECPVDASTYTVAVDGLAELAERVRPKLITTGASLNLTPHPVAEIRAVADSVGAYVLFDAAHACGMIAGGRWPNPLDQGADLMTMSTYKSLGGPAGGLVFTDRDDLAARLDAIAYPGLTANFDVAKTAALTITMFDWLEFGPAYTAAMIDNSIALAGELEARGLPVFRTDRGPTETYQFALDMSADGGGHAAAVRLREANLLTCAIGLPHDDGAGLRFGTPEITRLGMTPADMPELADLIAAGLGDAPAEVAARSSAMRRRFDTVHFVRS